MEFPYRVVVQDGKPEYNEAAGKPEPCCGEMKRALKNNYDVELHLRGGLTVDRSRPSVWLYLWHHDVNDEGWDRSHYEARCCPFCGQPFTFRKVARVKRVVRKETRTTEITRDVNEDTPLPLEE